MHSSLGIDIAMRELIRLTPSILYTDREAIVKYSLCIRAMTRTERYIGTHAHHLSDPEVGRLWRIALAHLTDFREITKCCRAHEDY